MEAIDIRYKSHESALNEFFDDVFEPATMERFTQMVKERIPILDAMGVSFSEYERGTLRVDMPLGPNINDKETAFGGSIVTLTTICGWSLLNLLLNKEEKRYDVLIAESATKYKRPIGDDFYAKARLHEGQILKMLRELITCGKSRVSIDVVVCGPDHQEAALFNGQYYVRPA